MIDRRKLLLLSPAMVLGAGMLGAAGWMAMREDGPVPIGGPFRLQAAIPGQAGGKEVTDADFRGRWMLVYFGFTHCPDACPTGLANLANAVDQLGEAKSRVAIVFITVDPERDTPQLMAEYVTAFEAPITGLSGTPEQIAAVARAYRVYYVKRPKPGGDPGRDYDVDHSSIIYAMDPRGRFAANFTHETPPDAIAAKLRTLMA